MAPSSVLPTSERLLKGLRTALLEIASSESLGAAALLRLSAADGVLNELILRRDGYYQADYYRRCRALAIEGAARFAVEAEDSELRNTVDALAPEVDPDWDFDRSSVAIHEALTCLSALVERADQSPASAQRFVRDVVELELDLHRRRQTESMSSQQLALPERGKITIDRVETYLAHRFPERGLRVSEIDELVGGFSKTTLLIRMVDSAGASSDIVLRIEKDHEKYVDLDAGNVAAEYDIVRFVHANGVPSAEPLFLETDSAWLGGPFMATRRVAGESIKVTGLDPKAETTAPGISESALKSVVEALAALHSVSTDGLRDTPIGHGQAHLTLAANTAAIIHSWDNQRWSDRMMATPATRHAFNWLRANIPADDEPPAIVHVDYGTHNILIHEGRVTAVLDWESARIGDPAEDLSYLFQSLPPDADREKMREWYAQASGRNISDYRLRYWDVYNALKVMLAGAHSTALYENDPLAGIEWSSLALNIFLHGAKSLLEKIALAEAARSAAGISRPTSQHVATASGEEFHDN